MSEEWRIGAEDWGAAIADTEGPQLVVAGPGTGKTEFLVRRAVHLIDDRGIDARSLLVLTFSRRGAADLRRRIGDGLDRSTAGLPVSTFHSFAVRVLEAHGGSLEGWSGMPTLLTGPEQVALVAALLAHEDPGPWPVTHRAMMRTRTFASDLADFLLRMAERRIDADMLETMVSRRPDWRALPAFHRRYTRELERLHRIDYGTLLDRAIEVMVADQVNTRLAAQYGHVLVDEYQDTSPAQAAMLEVLTRAHRNLTVAADPYQSIYGFRGADVENVARFEETYPGSDGRPARRIVLDRSFRVPAEILRAAERVAAGRELPGGAGPVVPAPHPGTVDVHTFDQASAEAEWVASEIERVHLTEHIPFASIAVLVRSTRNLLPELSRALDRRRIPHDTPDTRLVDHPAIQLIFDLALAAACVGSDDPLVRLQTEAPLRRILLGPLVGLTVAEERALRRQLAREGTGWVESLRARADLADLADLLADGTWARDASAADGFWQMWDRLDRLTGFALAPQHREHRSAWAAFSQVLEQQKERDPRVTMVEYRRMSEDDDFEATPLLSHRPADEDRITLTTLHQAKGLEFDVVFIADATEDTFPDLRRGFNPLDPQALAGPTDRSTWLLERLQEETRVAYTSMTRARRRLVMTATTAGIDESERRPSRFLLAAAGVERVDDLAPAPTEGAGPITALGMQTALRRTLMDPEAPAAARLAAANVLAGETEAWSAARFAGVVAAGPDRGVFASPPQLSPSQAEAYEGCPRRYVLERRLAMADTSSDYARYGSLVHSVLERSDRAAMASGRPRADLDDALSALAAVWAEEADFGSRWLDEIWRAKAESLLRRLHEEWPPDSVATVAVEHPLQLDLGGARWIGRADRVERLTDGTTRVVDYKTSTRIMSKPKAAESLQLAFYALAAEADPGIVDRVSSAELWYPATDLVGYRRELDLARLPDLQERLEAITEAILDERWDPTPGEACERCSVRLVCPEWPEGREAFVG